MPTPTEKNAQKIEELVRLSGELTRRVDQVAADAGWSKEWVEKLRAVDEDLRTKLAVLEHTVAEERKIREEWGKRGWGAAQVVIGAVIGSALTLLVRRFGGP